MLLSCTGHIEGAREQGNGFSPKPVLMIEGEGLFDNSDIHLFLKKWGNALRGLWNLSLLKTQCNSIWRAANKPLCTGDSGVLQVNASQLNRRDWNQVEGFSLEWTCVRIVLIQTALRFHCTFLTRGLLYVLKMYTNHHDPSWVKTVKTSLQIRQVDSEGVV